MLAVLALVVALISSQALARGLNARSVLGLVVPALILWLVWAVGFLAPVVRQVWRSSRAGVPHD